MIVSFLNEDIHDLCCYFEVAEAKLGDIPAQELNRILAEVEAFDNADELLEMFGKNIGILDDDNTLRVRTESTNIVLMLAVGNRIIRDDDDIPLWNSVTRLKIMDISCENE